MIAIDTSSLSRWLVGVPGEATERISFAARRGVAYLPPVVVTEVLSRPGMSDELREIVLAYPTLEILDGYWERAGLLRAGLKHRHGLKANLADCLIAQSCIDHDVPLITYDRDFRHFVQAGLTFA